jgi:hypothetical protein
MVFVITFMFIVECLHCFRCEEAHQNDLSSQYVIVSWMRMIISTSDHLILLLEFPHSDIFLVNLVNIVFVEDNGCNVLHSESYTLLITQCNWFYLQDILILFDAMSHSRWVQWRLLQIHNDPWMLLRTHNQSLLYMCTKNSSPATASRQVVCFTFDTFETNFSLGRFLSFTSLVFFIKACVGATIHNESNDAARHEVVIPIVKFISDRYCLFSFERVNVQGATRSYCCFNDTVYFMM